MARKNAKTETAKGAPKNAPETGVRDTNGDVVGSARPRETIVPGHAGRSVPLSQQYGESTQEEHRKSGYNYPDSFYKKPIPAEERVEGGPMFEGEKARKSAPENKSATKAEDEK